MKVFENDADWEERAWELAKKLEIGRASCRERV